MSCYRVAETAFELETVYARTPRMLADYRTEEPPELTIRTTEAEIAAEGAKLEEAHSPAYVESLLVYRKLCDYLLGKDVLLFHGSALALDGEVYLFAAPSGTGKSTHARLWRERFGPRVVMVNDDKPLLGLGAGGVTVYGSPWDGKHRLSSNIALPLKALCLLRRGERNEIRPVTAREALPALLRQAYRPEVLARVLPLVTRLAEAVPLYELRCNVDPEAAEVAWRGMNTEDLRLKNE